MVPKGSDHCWFFVIRDFIQTYGHIILFKMGFRGTPIGLKIGNGSHPWGWRKANRFKNYCILGDSILQTISLRHLKVLIFGWKLAEEVLLWSWRLSLEVIPEVKWSQKDYLLEKLHMDWWNYYHGVKYRLWKYFQGVEDGFWKSSRRSKRVKLGQ